MLQPTSIRPTNRAPTATDAKLSPIEMEVRAIAPALESSPWLVDPRGNCACAGPPRPLDVSSTALSMVGPPPWPYHVVGYVSVRAVSKDSVSAWGVRNTSAAPGAGTVIGQP